MNSIGKIIAYTLEYKKWYIGMACFVITISFLSLINPLLSKQVVDLIVSQIAGKSVDTNRFWWLLGAIIVSDISISLFTAFGQWLGDILMVKLQTFLSKNFYQHILSLNIGYYDNEITGRMVNKMYRGITSITEFIQSMLNNFLPFFLTAFVTIVILAKYSLIISVLLAILFPLYIVISHGSSMNWMKYEGKKNAISDASQGRVFESLVGIRVVKSFAAEILELTSYITDRKHIEKLTIAQTKGWHLYDFYRRFLLNVILFGIYSYIVYWTFYGKYTLGEMTLLLQLVQQARFPLFAMSFILGQIQQASAGSTDFFKVMETKTAITDKLNATALTIPQKYPRDHALVEFAHIQFHYEETKQVLSDISFHLKPGRKLALVGESGQGKSTIVNLLLRYYEPQKGTITIGEQNISEITQESLHKHIAVVFQESLLFSGTIMENIRYGNTNATDDEVFQAAKAANAHAFILELTDGYQSLIGERGVKLSGGQKQRIAIARAMIKNAPIIILDEATSALDSKSELEVQKGLNKLLSGRTSIIIAHRLSTIASCDHILVLAGGKVAQYGHPKDLLAQKDGLYAEMVSLQGSLLAGPNQQTVEKLKKFDIVG